MDCCPKRPWIFCCSFPYFHLPFCPSHTLTHQKPQNTNYTTLQLFGGSAFTKGYFFGLEDYNKASWFQNFVASIAGASASLLVSAPLDVIKTRIQNKNFDNPEGGFKIVKNMMKHEGISSFFKGLTPKVCSPSFSVG